MEDLDAIGVEKWYKVYSQVSVSKLEKGRGGGKEGRGKTILVVHGIEMYNVSLSFLGYL